MTECEFPDHQDGTRNLFCRCGKVKDPAALKRVRIEPRFTGPASMNPNIQHFWETGEVDRV
jgi:hypothetical protein